MFVFSPHLINIDNIYITFWGHKGNNHASISIQIQTMLLCICFLLIPLLYAICGIIKLKTICGLYNSKLFIVKFHIQKNTFT